MSSRARASQHAAPASATQTTTSTSTQVQENPSGPYPIRIPASGTLHLRAETSDNSTLTGESSSSEVAQAQPERRVQWAEGVVNNEGLGRKSSKVCCIYHKPRAAGESSDEEDSSDSSSEDDESDNDDGAARPASKTRSGCTESSQPVRVHNQRKNAYERQPRN